MIIKYIKLISLVCALTLLCSCSGDENVKRQKALFKFEQNLSALIKNSDTISFLDSFVGQNDVSEEQLLDLAKMSFIYELTPSYIKNAIDRKTAIYGRIFSNNDNSIASFLPGDGNYDVNITMHSYENNHIALVTYGTADFTEVNSVEFVLLYTENKWKIFTINFFEI